MNGHLSDVDVVVIGAGAAGLAAGKRLVEARASAVVVEARRRIGGRSMTIPTRLGHPVDLGCEWLHSADLNPWTLIGRAMGLTIDERLPDWRSRVSRLRGNAAQSDWGSAYADFEERMEEAAKAPTDIAAAALLPADAPWNALINAVSTWANGVELDRLSVHDHVRYADSGINWRVCEGYGALIAGYGSTLPIRTETIVTRIDHRGRQVVVATTQGDLRAQAVIVTVPPTVLAAEAIGFDPPLPDKIAAAQGLPLGIANKLFLALEPADADFPIDCHVLGATDRVATGSYQLRPHGWPMVAAYFGGRLATELEAGGVSAMADFAIGELAGVFGNGIRQRLKPIAASCWVGDPFARGSYSYALPGHAEDRRRLASPVDRRVFFAGEACSPRDFSTAHGAYRTGRAAAEEVIATYNFN